MIIANLKSQKSENENINIKSKKFRPLLSTQRKQPTQHKQSRQKSLWFIVNQRSAKKPLGFIPHPSFQVTLTTNPPLQNKSDTESDYGSDGSVYNVGKYSSRFVFGFVFVTIVLAGEVVQWAAKRSKRNGEMDWWPKEPILPLLLTPGGDFGGARYWWNFIQKHLLFLTFKSHF